VTKIVVADKDIQSYKHDIGVYPADVFLKFAVLMVITLAGEGDRTFALALVALKEDFSQFSQPLCGIIAAVIGSVAIHPFVVPWHKTDAQRYLTSCSADKTSHHCRGWSHS
jgi:hypothetical protein